MKYYIKFNFSRIKVVPISNLLVLLIWGWLCAEMLIAIAAPAEQVLQKSHIEEIVVDCKSISVVDSHEVWSSRYKLVLETDDVTYFAWYPRGTFQEYKELMDEQFSDKATVTLTMRISDDVSLLDKLFDRITVYDVRDENAVYYSLDDYLENYKREQHEALFVSPLIFGAWLLFLLYILFVYRIMVISRR